MVPMTASASTHARLTPTHVTPPPTARTTQVVGSGHSFVPCMTAQTVVDMSKLKRVFEVDKRKKTVTIDGGMTYAELVTRLSGTGLTLANTHVREMHSVTLTRVA